MTSQLPELRFQVNNLGSIRCGEFTQKPLTVFCGENNTGKTWTLYVLYHFHQLAQTPALLEEDRNLPSREDLNKFVSIDIPYIFNSSSVAFEDAEFSVLGGQNWREVFNTLQQRKAFLMPAERNGLHLFFRELSARRTTLLHRASREGIDLEELLSDVIRSRYAVPIADYIDWLNNLPAIQESAKSEFHRQAERVKRRLAGGAYRIDVRTGSIDFRPYGSRHGERRNVTMGLHTTSSAVKSLFALWFYLEYQAREGDILMIDEPELNLHPANQLKMARLLARLVNAGINVAISTHSDYIVREFNSLIMLSQNGGRQLQRKYRYQDEEVLSPEQVGAYWFDDQAQTITPFKITPDDGIHADTFDNVIRQLNTVNDDIYHGIRVQREYRGND